MEYNFNLQQAQAKALLDLLGELPANRAAVLYMTIHNQAVEQEQKARQLPKKTTSTRTKKEKSNG